MPLTMRAASAADRGGRRTSHDRDRRPRPRRAAPMTRRPAAGPGTAIRCPGSGEAAGLVTRPRPNGNAKTFSTTAPGSTSSAGSSGEHRHAERTAANRPRTAAGSTRTQPSTSSDRPGEELERGRRTDRDPGPAEPPGARPGRRRAGTARAPAGRRRRWPGSGRRPAVRSPPAAPGPAAAAATPAPPAGAAGASQRADGDQREPHPGVGPPAAPPGERAGQSEHGHARLVRQVAQQLVAGAGRRSRPGPGTACRSRAAGGPPSSMTMHLFLGPVGAPAGPLR